MRYLVIGSIVGVITIGCVFGFYIFLGSGGNKEPASAESFSTLPAIEYGDLNPSDFVKLIVVNTDPKGRVACKNNDSGFEFFVKLIDNRYSLQSACLHNPGPSGYLFVVAEFLSTYYSLPYFTALNLQKDTRVFIGNVATSTDNDLLSYTE